LSKQLEYYLHPTQNYISLCVVEINNNGYTALCVAIDTHRSENTYLENGQISDKQPENRYLENGPFENRHLINNI